MRPCCVFIGQTRTILRMACWLLVNSFLDRGLPLPDRSNESKTVLESSKRNHLFFSKPIASPAAIRCLQSACTHAATVPPYLSNSLKVIARTSLGMRVI